MDEINLEVFGNKSSASQPGVQPGRSAPTTTVDYMENEKNNILNSISLTQWAVCAPNTYKPVSITFPQLKSGVYSISVSQYHGIIYQKKDVCVDDLLRFPDSVSNKILNEIAIFWEKGNKFKEKGFLHRRGYLLHGPAGGGKSSVVQQIVADIVKANGIVFQCDCHPAVFNDGLLQFRKVEPNRPIVCIFEDLDSIIEEHGEDDILQLLDGASHINICLNIGTTNYPEKLDRRLVARPRRFDRVITIGMPSSEVRKMYFEKKLKIAENEVNKWVEASEGFSFAACAELVISVCCFEKPFDEAVKYLKELQSAKVHSRDYDNIDGVGFANKVGFGK